MPTHHEYRGYVFTIGYRSELPAYIVDFPDFREIITSGESLAEAFTHACEALDLHLESIAKSKRRPPEPKYWLLLKKAANRPQSLYLMAWVLLGLAPSFLLAFIVNGFTFLFTLATLGAAVGWGIGTLSLMLIRRASIDSQGSLVDRRGRVICEHPGHPLAFSLRALFLVSALSAIAAVAARKLYSSGDLDGAMYLATPLFAFAGGFVWLYSKQRGAQSGLLIFLITAGAMVVWLICAGAIPHHQAPESGMGVF